MKVGAVIRSPLKSRIAESVQNMSEEKWLITRRDFLSASTCAALSINTGCGMLQRNRSSSRLKFGIVADAHYADRNAGGSRKYRESLSKMAECVELMNDQKVDFLISLGDFKDQGPGAKESETLGFLKEIEKVFSGFRGDRYHVLGNHDLDSISKKQFLDTVEVSGIEKDQSYYSFDKGGVHCVVLDACFTSKGAAYDHGNFSWKDANVPQDQIDWLRKDLAASSLPVIAFVHQQIDPEGKKCVNNAAEVREVLNESGRTIAVFQGHHHPGQYTQANNIHYYTLIAMVEGAGEENNSYAIVEVFADNSLMITGYRRALDVPAS